MEMNNSPISVRVARLNSEITGKTRCDELNSLITREGLLDSLQVLYDECCIETVRKSDKNIAAFVDTYKETMRKLRKSRVNLGDFEVKTCIGRGHFGDVHLVVEKTTRDIYAMKSIRKCDSLDAKKTKFHEERNIMAMTRSQWLTSLQYAFQDSTHLYFIMEFHPGGDLLGLLYKQGGTLPESAAVFYLAEILLGLRDLHNMGYVHRDIKPDNILLDRCGHVKLADFGSAAKLDPSGYVAEGPPVGTPDYVAPEILETIENKNGKIRYGVLCDFWSVGVLAFELTVGNTPFKGNSTTAVYSKILNHTNSLKFPPDITLSQAYTDLIKRLVVEQKTRLNLPDIMKHALFKSVQFDTLREQVPPFVPKINAFDDTSNFSDVPVRKKIPSIENFKKRTQFSGRNLPFIGFSYTPVLFEPEQFNTGCVKDEHVEDLKKELEKLRKNLAKHEDVPMEKENLERKLEEKTRKLENIESVRSKLEKELAVNIAETAALRRTLELERKDRSELEKKALDLIKSAKLKWENEEKRKIDALNITLEEQSAKIRQLSETNKILNEQVQHALKMEFKHKSSLETVENLSRRSVIGLETRLERVTTDTQTRISDLQGRLNEQFFQKSALERTISKMKEKESELNTKLENSTFEYQNLSAQIDVAEKLIRDLETKVNTLETESVMLENYKRDYERLKEKRNEDRKLIKELENRCTHLELENSNGVKLKREIDELNEKLKNMALELKKMDALEIELQKEKERIKSLNKQLEENVNGSESQELREIRTKYWRVEKELNNVKIDKRILERELKESNATNASLSEEIAKLNVKLEENRKIHEGALLEMNSMNDSLTLELIKMKEIEKSLDARLQSERNINDESRTIVRELKALSNGKEEKIVKMQHELDALQREIAKNTAEKDAAREQLEAFHKEKLALRNEYEKLLHENENYKMNLNALREACTLLESQVVEYEKIAESFKEKEQKLNENTEKLIKDLCDAKKEIQLAKQQTNEEKSFRLLAETKSQRLLDEIATLQSENEAYKKQAMDYRQFSNQLTEELTAVEEKNNELAIMERSFERQIEDYELENRQLKERASEYITELHKCREINYKLAHEINQLKETKRALTDKCNGLENVFHEKSAYYRERELKTDATIKQQIKLIDYLQTKIDETSQNKKKTFALFGHSKKENTPPITLSMNYKDLEVQLQKERALNKTLQEEIYKMKTENSQKLNRNKSEIVSPRTKNAMQKLVQSPSKNTKRMHHNIPHRLESKLCAKVLKCAQCNNNILLGRYMSVCKECNVSVHTNCGNSLTNSCGIPSEFVEHYKDTLTKLPDQKTEEETHRNVESWIKIASSKNNWEKHYAILSETTLKLYSEPGTKNPTQTFELKPENSHGKIIMEPLISELDVPVAKSDIPYLIKLEITPNASCWPTKTLTILTLSLQDKEKWFKAFQNVLNDNSVDMFSSERVVSIPEGLVVNCVVDLTEDMKAIGTQKGLFCLYNETLHPIEGFTEVHQFGILRSTQTLIAIVNAKNVLIACDLNHLINVTQCTAAFTKPVLKYSNVDVKGLNGFHLIETSSKHGMFCVATLKQLAIVSWDEELRSFVTLKVLDTAEPTGTVLFTEHSIIVGADKFFEIDIVTFRAEEFLDCSNPKLRAALKCYKIGSYPLSIVETSENPREYLVAFNEFFIFVDEYGSPSRAKEWNVERLPLAVFYTKPYLYIVEFSAVEIHRIGEQTCEQENEQPSSDFVRIQLGKFNFIGGNERKGIYIVHEGCVKLIEGRKIYDDDTTVASSVGTRENSIDRFSFTSSMVRSLDDEEIDENNEKVKEKCVTFAQTSL